MQLLDLLDDVPTFEGTLVSLEMQQLLRSPLNIKNDWQTAESLLKRAQKAFPEKLELVIALYKLYAYSNRFDESLLLIEEVLTRSAALAGFNSDWRLLDSDSACWYPAQGPVRNYLYSLKAHGFVRLRKGEVRIAYDVLCKLMELDPDDQVGGNVVYEMSKRLRRQI